MIKVGIIGLPNAGKSTLFNLLTNAQALIAPYPFSTVTPNKANLKIYDKTAEELARAARAADILRTEVEIWDIAGLIEGASRGEGLGNEFLGQAMSCDILIHLIRQDSLEKMKYAENTVLTEISLFDHKCLQTPFERSRRMAKLYPSDTQHVKWDKIISKAYYGSKDGEALNNILNSDELKAITELGLISSKPRINLINTSGEKNLERFSANLLELYTLSTLKDDELEFLGYSNEQLLEFLSQLSNEIISKANQKRFYTSGHLGIGQWLIDPEATAQQCSMLVHHELGETIKNVRVATPDNFKKHPIWPELQKLGLVKTNGPKYVPRDKELLYFVT